MFKLTTIATALLIATAINLIVFAVSWRRKSSRGDTYFALGMACVALWTLAATLDYASVPIAAKVFFARLEYTGYNTAFFFFIAFVLAYTGTENWLGGWRGKLILALLPLSNILLAWTNDLHGLLWSGFTPNDPVNNTVIFEHGPAFTWVVITGYLMIAMIILPLWNAARSGAPLARRQARLLFFASLVPVAGNLLYLFQGDALQGVDWTSILFSISGLFFMQALFGTRLLDLAPIAREKLLSSLSDGMIVLDAQDRIIDVNAASAALAGMSPAALVGLPLPQGLPRLQDALQNAGEGEGSVELRIEDRYYDVLVSPLHDRGQEEIGRLLILRDITARKQNELRLLQLTQAVEQNPAVIIVTDTQGRITYVNPQFTELTGYSYEEALGQNPNIMQSGHTPDDVYRDLWSTIRSGKTWQGEFLNKKKNGEFYWEQATIAPVLDANGEILNFIAIKENITERKQNLEALQVANQQLANQLREIEALQAALREQTLRDPLTGLYNRRFLDESLPHEFHRAARTASPLTILLLDIDRFKEANDTYGHAVGDACLTALAELLQSSTRKSDLLCRYGGDEFLLVLPDTPSAQGARLAEDLRARGEERLITHTGHATGCTLSIGLASFPEHASDIGQVIQRADQALYVSKESGRNRVTVWSESTAGSVAEN